jgi:penicillin-binding protein 1C
VAVIATLGPSRREPLDARAVRSTRVVDRHLRPIWERPNAHGGYGYDATDADLAPAVVLATLAGEDHLFFGHLGVEPTGIARALWLDLRAGRLAYGGSTITQQLAKLIARDAGAPADRSRGALRKAEEAWTALRIERGADKRAILRQYLTRAYYGRRAYGIVAAAHRYYGKRPADLTLDEAALLAVLPRAPSAYDPARRPEAALRRRAHVLRTMAVRGWLSRAEADAAARRPIALADEPRNAVRAPHLVDALLVSGALPAGAPLTRTTVDVRLEERLRTRLRAHLEALRTHGVAQAGVVVVDNASGDVLAMVGSADYDDEEARGAINAATARRHPGSTLKPFVFALALEDGAHPGSPVLDVPTQWRGYAPRALGGRHHGVVSLRDALGSSLNVPATRLAGAQGEARVARLLRDVGLRTVREDGRYGVAVALGAPETRLLDLAEAYATLARGGTHVPLRLALAPGEAPGTPREGRRVLSETSAYLVTRMLSEPAARRLTFGVETPLELPFPVAVKTGTSQGHDDGVVVGYTRDVTVAVWVGDFRGHARHQLVAMTTAAPLFRDAMLLVHEDGAPPAAGRPEGIVEVSVCPLSGLRRGSHCPHARVEEVAAAHAPGRVCDWHGPHDALRLPAEVALAVPGAAALPRAPGERAVQILGPAEGARYAVDPALPRETQRLHLRVAVRPDGGEAAPAWVRWRVDGEVVAESAPPYAASWTLAQGAHEVRAELPDGRADVRRIEVRDPAARGERGDGRTR